MVWIGNVMSIALMHSKHLGLFEVDELIAEVEEYTHICWRKSMLEFILATATIVGQVQIDANTFETDFLTQDNEIVTILQRLVQKTNFRGLLNVSEDFRVLR